MNRYVRRLAILEHRRAEDAALDAALASYAPLLDAAEAAVSGEWGRAVRAHGLTPTKALLVGFPPLPDGVDRVVMRAYAEALGEAGLWRTA